ncbi:integrase core domain-containing protein, partial [Defluviimonas sp. D31]|uniref:integrase core domain-containing protein n=1 Tax=Defluviimonas sp. D31 TaxID=3083253 RepID=UPI00296FCE4C
QRSRLSITGTRDHHPSGAEAAHALTIKLDQSGKAAHFLLSMDRRSVKKNRTLSPRNRNTAYSRQMRIDMICEANEIEHRLTKPNHPWSLRDQDLIQWIKSPENGQVERMNRTIKDATVKRFHYDNHDQLRSHLADVMAAYNFARRLKTLSGLMPYEHICKVWSSEPDRFIVDPIHQMPGLNT